MKAEKCKIIVEDGRQYVVMPSGDIIPQQVFTRVFDGTDNAPYVIVKILVDLVNTDK